MAYLINVYVFNDLGPSAVSTYSVHFYFRAPWNAWSRIQSEGLGNPALGDPEVDQGP